jgi:hypothetical protein
MYKASLRYKGGTCLGRGIVMAVADRESVSNVSAPSEVFYGRWDGHRSMNIWMRQKSTHPDPFPGATEVVRARKLQLSGIGNRHTVPAFSFGTVQGSVSGV